MDDRDVGGDAAHVVTGFAGLLPVRNTDGRRSWPESVKGRIVRESFAVGAVVNDIARRHGISPQQLTHWRRAAREGRLALVEDAGMSFAPLAIDAVADPEMGDTVEIVLGRVGIRVSAGTSSVRIAEIAAALEARL